MHTTSQCGTCNGFEEATNEFEKGGWHVFLMSIGAISLPTALVLSKPQRSIIGVSNCNLA